MGKAADKSPPRYVLQIVEGPNAGRTFALAKEKVVIGRLKKHDLVLSDAAISGTHAVVTVTEFGCFIQDMNSTHGTLVNGQKITSDTSLTNGAQIVLGNSKFVFRVLPGATQRPAATPAAKPKAPEPAPQAAPEPAQDEMQLDADQLDFDGAADESEGEHVSVLDYGGREGIPILPFAVVGAVTLIAILAIVHIKTKNKGGLWGMIRPEKNLLRPYAAFDGELGGSGTPQGWQAAGQGYQWSVKEDPDLGKFASAQSTAGCSPASQGQLLRAKAIRVADRYGYRLSGKIKANQCQGIATVKLRWACAGYPFYAFEQFLDVVAQDTEWVDVSRIVPIPPGASTITVSCAVFGRVGTAGFAELKLNDSSVLDKAPTNYEVEYPDNLLIKPTDRGVVNVLSNSNPVLWNGELTATSAGPPHFARQALSAAVEGYPSIDEETHCLVFAGKMWLPGSRKPMSYLERLVAQPEGIDLDFTLTPPPGVKHIIPGVSFAVSPDLMSSGALVLQAGKYVPKTGPFSVEEAEEIVWGTDPDRVILSYDKPGLLKYEVLDGRHIIAYIGPSQTVTAAAEAKTKVTITNISVKKDAVFETGIATAESLLGDKQWGKAITHARSLLEVAVFSEEQLGKVKENIAAITADLDKRVQEVQKQIAQAEKAQTVEGMAKVEDDIEKLLKPVEGTELEPKVAALEKALASARLRVRAVFEAAAKRYVDRAKEHRQKGELLIARIYLDNVMRQYPRTQVAQDAAAVLKAVLKELEVAQWLADKLESARGAERIKFWSKARERYQEIIDKHPDSKEAAEARKRLADLKQAEAQQEQEPKQPKK